MKNRAICFAVLGGLAVLTAMGDEVIFKSGDRLSGTVVKVAGGKMTFTSTVAGAVTLNMADIKTFSTDNPIEIVLADGAVVQQKVGAGAAEGEVAVQADGAAQPLALASIVTVNPDKVKWTGIVSAGANLVRGNTKSDTATVSAEAILRRENDRTSLGAGYVYSRQRDNATGDSNTSADNWFIKGQYDYFFSKKMYGYGNVRVEKDKIANLDLRVTPGAGVGYQWIEESSLRFFTECGLSYVYEEYANPSRTEKYLAGRVAYRFDKTLNDAVKAYHTLEYIPSLEDFGTYLVNTDVGVRAAMTARLALDAKIQLAFNSEPAPGRNKKDVRYILGAGWMF